MSRSDNTFKLAPEQGNDCLHGGIKKLPEFLSAGELEKYLPNTCTAGRGWGGRIRNLYGIRSEFDRQAGVTRMATNVLMEICGEPVKEWLDFVFPQGAKQSAQLRLRDGCLHRRC